MPSSAPLLLLPGLICDERTFVPQIAAFPGAVAFPGWRNRFRDLGDMAAAVLDQAPPRFALLGHSMGARVALEVVRRAPERVERLALVSTGFHGVAPGEADKRHALRDLGREQGMAALVDAWLPPMIAPDNRPALMAPLHAMASEQGLDGFEAQIAALLARPAVEALLGTIACPVLSCTGESDQWSPPAQAHDIGAAIPGAVVAIVPGAGHFLPRERAQAFNAVLARWLA